MSFPFYGKMWIATKQQLKDVALCEKVLAELEPTMNRNYVHHLIGNLYARYLILCNNLSELYDQTLQAQKRPMLEKLMIATKQRWLEILQDIEKIEMSQFVYVDDALIELCLVPQDVQFLRPFYFPRRRDVEYQKLMDEGPKVEEVIDEATLKIPAKFRKILTPEELEAKRKKDEITKAVNLIKAHEKAKQGRIKAFHIKEFPIELKPKPKNVGHQITYDFQYNQDQIPMYKIKRTFYKYDLFEEPLDLEKYDYYTPPTIKVNKYGMKTLIPREPKVFSEKVKKASESFIKDLSVDSSSKIEAVCKIQNCYRRFRMKKLIKKRIRTRNEIMGIFKKPLDLDLPDLKKIDNENQLKRSLRKKEFDEALKKAIEDEKARILKIKSEVIMEDITDDIRAWFREFYDVAVDFDRYPEEFEGGTILVMRGETMTAEEFKIECRKSDTQKNAEKVKIQKALKEQKALDLKKMEDEQKQEIEKNKKELKEGPTWDFSKMKKWKAFENLEEAFKNIVHDFQSIDELANWKESLIWDWVTIDAYADVHLELRKVVDNFMRVELEILRHALANDKNLNYEKQKSKKEKGKKKKKDKEDDDPFEGKTVEMCYEELLKMNIIRKFTKKSLDEFVGDRNYAAKDFRVANKYPPQAYGDVRHLIQNWILGTDCEIKSLCVVGPTMCGKKFLVEAVCSEMDAIIFDISPPNVKDIKDMTKFLKLVMEMALKFQPSVILIDGAHKPFIRKISEKIKDENPKKLGKFLMKNVVKQLTTEDAVVLIGTTNEPWNCNPASLKSCYEKFLFFPTKLDFQTSLMAWQKGLEKKRIYNFDAVSLGEVSRNFTTGDILDSIDSHISLKRRVMLSCKPLTCEELMENLIATKVPIDEKIAKKFNQFALSVDPYANERTITVARLQKDIDKENATKAKRKEIARQAAEKKAAAKKL